MNAMKQKQARRVLRVRRVRAKITGTAERPRLAVRRTLKHIFVQLIDDSARLTLAAASDKDIKDTGLNKTALATEVGKLIAERAKAKNIGTVVFDRRDKKYHGRVRAVAEGAREAGLVF